MEPSPKEYGNSLFGRRFGIGVQSPSGYEARCLLNTELLRCYAGPNDTIPNNMDTLFYQDWLDVMTKGKSHYVVNSLSKIRHKGWELYVVSRIIHLLDDLEIEFVCQQLVRKKDGNRYLVDLYFPQFGIYIEIDEAHHLNEDNAIKDKLRQREILEATNLEEIRVPIVDADKKERSLQEINGDIQANIEKIKTLKAAQISDKTFVPWQASSRYNPQTYIQKGSIEVSSNVALRRQVDVIRLFGTEFKGWQKGTWPWKSPIGGTNYQVWFPKLYKAKDWTNSISNDGLKIRETQTNGGSHESAFQK